MATMRTRPEHLTDEAIATVVKAHWSIAANTLEYLPIGFGSHHWVLIERTGHRWFVTGDAVADSSQRLSGLTAALNTTYALRHNCVVVAPQAGIDGTLLSITGRYAIALYPYLDRLSDATADPQQIISMIIALHATTSDIGDLTPIDDLRICGRRGPRSRAGRRGHPWRRTVRRGLRRSCPATPDEDLRIVHLVRRDGSQPR